MPPSLPGVGQSTPIYTKRANECIAPPPSFAGSGRRRPLSAPNSDAGVLQRISSSCTPNKRLVWVEARGIAFTATKYGAEVLRFFSAPSASR